MDLARLTDDVENISRGYAERHGIDRDRTWFLLKLQEEVGELTQAFLMRAGQARTKGFSAEEINERFGAELADVLCHTLQPPEWSLPQTRAAALADGTDKVSPPAAR